MKTYAITDHETGALAGNFEGESREEAIAAYVAAAGYSSLREAAEAAGKSVAEFVADLDTKELD